MKGFLRRFLYNGLAMLVVVFLLPGLYFQSPAVLIPVFIIFGFGNSIVRFITGRIFECPNGRAYVAVAFIINTVLYTASVAAMPKFIAAGMLPFMLGITLTAIAGAAFAQMEIDINETGEYCENKNGCNGFGRYFARRPAGRIRYQ